MRFVEKLSCPKCGGAVAEGRRRRLRCQACRAVYKIDGGVVDFLLDKSLRTALEDADYDAKAGYDDARMARIGAAWKAVFDQAGLDITGKTVLEIGAGTGALTIGLLRGSAVGSILATDISSQFLKLTLARGEGDARLAAVRCDCNHIPVQDGTVDLVLGRSILHHLIDYDQVLAQCARILGPGGKAIFYEPVLEGKLIVAMYAAMVLEQVERDGTSDFTEQEVNKLRAVQRHITKAAWYPQDRASLAKLEDKYIFTLPGLSETGLKAGFSRTEFLRGANPPKPPYWSNFLHVMRPHGVSEDKLDAYRFLSEGYAQTFGLFEDINYPPMGYFCFTK